MSQIEIAQIIEQINPLLSLWYNPIAERLSGLPFPAFGYKKTLLLENNGSKLD